MLTAENTLLCIFSYNMGQTLERCILSTLKMCPGFDLAIIDDQSEDEETRAVIVRHRGSFRYCLTSEGAKEGRRHGHLYNNIQRMCELAGAQDYEYIFLIQDDTQFVRPMDEAICQQYYDLFNSDEMVLQVDPRFLRKGYEYEILEPQRAYAFPAGDPRRSYADVGIIRLSVLNSLKCEFRDSEADNKKMLSRLGCVRLFPFTPIMMHVPFPVSYRGGKKKRSLLPFYRGTYEFHELSQREKRAMDERDLSDIPYFRKFLRPKNMYLARLVYALVTDASALR
jgi:hypothetical protein